MMSINHLSAQYSSEGIVLICDSPIYKAKKMIPVPDIFFDEEKKEYVLYPEFTSKLFEVFESWKTLLCISLQEFYLVILRAVSKSSISKEVRSKLVVEMQKHVSRGSSRGVIGGGAFTLTKTPVAPSYIQVHNLIAARISAQYR
jgi:hypothetical protein